MTKVKRNEPCPCGSGKKHKHCCLTSKPGPSQGSERELILYHSAASSAISYTADERRSSLEKMEQYLISPDWVGFEEEASPSFFYPYHDFLRESGNEKALVLSREAFRFWMCFNGELDDQKTIIDHFLESQALSPGERAYLTMMRDTCMMMYQVVDVKPKTLVLDDLITGHEVEILKPLYPGNAGKWDLVAARIVPVGVSGEPEIDGGVFLLPRLFKSVMIQMVRENLEIYSGITDPKNNVGLYRGLPGLFYQMFLQPMVSSDMMQLRTPAGYNMFPVRSIFNISDRDAMVEGLNQSAAIEALAGSESWRWYEDASRENLLGEIALEGDSMIVTTSSELHGAMAADTMPVILNDSIVFEGGEVQIMDEDHSKSPAEPAE